MCVEYESIAIAAAQLLRVIANVASESLLCGIWECLLTRATATSRENSSPLLMCQRNPNPLLRCSFSEWLPCGLLRGCPMASKSVCNLLRKQTRKHVCACTFKSTYKYPKNKEQKTKQQNNKYVLCVQEPPVWARGTATSRASLPSWLLRVHSKSSFYEFIVVGSALVRGPRRD